MKKMPLDFENFPGVAGIANIRAARGAHDAIATRPALALAQMFPDAPQQPMAGGRVCDSVWYGLGAQGQNDAAIDYELRRYGQMFNYNPYGNGAGTTCTQTAVCALDFGTAGLWSTYSGTGANPLAASRASRRMIVSGAEHNIRTRNGVILRSTRVGLGPPAMPTIHYEGCKGACRGGGSGERRRGLRAAERLAESVTSRCRGLCGLFGGGGSGRRLRGDVRHSQQRCVTALSPVVASRGATG